MKNTEGALVGERYRLDQPIGRGKAGIVWLAFDTMLHRTVAAKPMYLDPEREPGEARRTALAEGKRAMRVVHPSAVTVYDALQDGDDVWLVMEYVPSRNMADFLAEHGTLTPEQAGYLGAALGAALASAHNAGVVHGAVEPGNVLLADDGGVKLTDIGIHGGTPDPAYLAPEVKRGATPTTEADAYGLGATLFRAVEGSAPFGQEGEDDPVVPSQSGPLTAALEKLLRSEPDLRPTLADTVSALRAVSKGRQAGFVPPTAPAMPTVRLMPPPPRVPPAGSATAATATRGAMAGVDPAPSSRRILLWALAAIVVVAAVIAVVVLL
ncbi:serine/threonine-protein kinase [Saccharomonospora xinjiangensis]|uniref:serine/threonine-protein kinase n=1 Tax=Saccharomonospora xinjiangensis TaxID=75294 RepID=UPI00106F8DF2|nr:serine/threonine-protein kinase [Saccharomonospora xinjiangensis]QBQ58924.1 Serine/threonine-protein kinase PrkC [Saccharomonospora xinjiangensis]